MPELELLEPQHRVPARRQVPGRAGAERAEPDDDVVDVSIGAFATVARRQSRPTARRLDVAQPRQQPAADVGGVVLHRREPAVGVGPRRHPALHRLADRPVLPVHHVPEVAGVGRVEVRRRHLGRLRTAAGTRSPCGRRPAAAARTPRRGRPSTTASGWGRPARPCAAPSRPRRAPAAATGSVVPGHGERPGALAVRDARRPSRGPARRRRTTAPAATARGAPGRSGSTRCSSRRRPSSWPRRRR